MIKNYLTNLKQEFSGYNTAKLMKRHHGGPDCLRGGAAPCAGVRRIFRRYGSCGLVTAIIAGVVIAVLGGASFQISGPQAR